MEKSKSTIRNVIRENREKEIDAQIAELKESLKEEGFSVDFGEIGQKTTYAFLHKSDGTEIVGYTFIKDLNYKVEKVGYLKALQQAIVRKNMLESREAENLK